MPSDRLFNLINIAVPLVLFSNSIQNGFVWDDRAAVISNADVDWNNPWYPLLTDDFWGQPLHLADSHKSYRPLTVISYKINHCLGGYNPVGYHIANVVIFVCAALSFRKVAKLYLNPVGTYAIHHDLQHYSKSVLVSDVACLLFLFHPIHVEAVSSIVGRADALCGLFYAISMWFYILGVRQGDTNLRSPINRILITFLSLLCGVCSSLAKEIGLTVFLMLGLIEYLEIIRYNISQSSNTTIANNKCSLLISKQMIWSLVTHPASIVRLGIILSIGITFLTFRSWLHGEHALYSWTVLENHIHLDPQLLTRILSYAQCHFWYFWKLLYPRYLCFDYGLVCIPMVRSIYDVRNILPLMTYIVLVGLLVKSVIQTRINLLFGICLTVVPLIPALNILFPVGTVLAERLLFIPSMGFCIAFSDLFVFDIVPFIESSSVLRLRSVPKDLPTKKNDGLLSDAKGLQHEEQPLKTVRFNVKKSKNKFKTLPPKMKEEMTIPPSLEETETIRTDGQSLHSGHWILLLPVLLLCGIRIVTRNHDWKNEHNLFGSALKVCPSSCKALSNYAITSMNERNFEAALIVGHQAIQLYPNQTTTWINLGSVYHNLKQFSESAFYFEKALELSPKHDKVTGYLGRVYYDWSQQQTNVEYQDYLKRLAIQKFETSVHVHHYAPASILHQLGSALIEIGNNRAGIIYLQLALEEIEIAKYENSLRVLTSIKADDSVNEVYTLNQLANGLINLKEYDIAIQTFEKGLQISPRSIELLTNLGNLYLRLDKKVQAKETMLHAIRICLENRQDDYKDGPGFPPPALLNNLGLLEMNSNNCSGAFGYFMEAYEIIQLQLSKNSKSLDSSNVHGGWSVSEIMTASEVIQQNLQKCYDILK